MYPVTILPTGQIRENCYLLESEKQLLIIDPGAESEKIIATIQQLEKQTVAILLTHTHYDHIGAIDALRELYQIPVYVHENELDWLTEPTLNLSRFSGLGDCLVTGAQTIQLGAQQIGDFSFTVVPTPGHSPGSVSYVFQDYVFVGDALFAGSIGRTDFPAGNTEQLLTSIRQNLFTLPTALLVYSGHGEPTTIGQELATNPFFQ